jgi:hypothetical protein
MKFYPYCSSRGADRLPKKGKIVRQNTPACLYPLPIVMGVESFGSLGRLLPLGAIDLPELLGFLLERGITDWL